MIKLGDRVTLFSDMRKKATVVELKKQKAQAWFVGGTSDVKVLATVKFDDGEVGVFSLNQLMPLHE